jgi:adenine-specific DNA-methyltransferase
LRLIETLHSERILLSYSSEGHVPMKELEAALPKVGVSAMHPLGEIGRYRPNQMASDAASSVKEYLVEVVKVLPEREPRRRADFADSVVFA